MQSLHDFCFDDNDEQPSLWRLLLPSASKPVKPCSASDSGSVTKQTF